MEEGGGESRVRKRFPTRAPDDNGETKLPPFPTREKNGVRKLSLSPTRSPAGPEQKKPPPPRVPRWLLLDRVVHCSSRIVDDASASAVAHDSVGRPVRASLRIADPPAVSRLYLHLTGRPEPEIDFAEPAAIAAHRNSILFRMRVPLEDPVFRGSVGGSFHEDFFVYSSSPSSSAPRLTLLPPCFDGGRHTDPKSDKYRNQHQQQRTMLDREMGILCHGEEEGESFTVADLTQRFSFSREVELCLLHHPPPASAIPIQWSVRKLQIPPDMKINLASWQTDAVVPIGGTRLCWVDYYQGMLLIDVVLALADSSSSKQDDEQLLQFIPLPSQALKYGRRLYQDAGEPDPLRCVCATDSGIIKLVCILTKQPPPDPFTITTWTLDDVHQGKWTKDVDTTMGAKEFFGLLGTAGHGCLPLVQPSVPLVSTVDPDVICFLLKDEDRSLFWMIEVNMMNKKLQASALNINEEGYPSIMGRRNYLFGHYFIPSKFSSYLSENAITRCGGDEAGGASAKSNGGAPVCLPMAAKGDGLSATVVHVASGVGSMRAPCNQQSATSEEAERPETVMPIFVRYCSGELTFTVSMDQSIKQLMQLYVQRTKTTLDNQYFVYDRKKLEPDHTCLSYGLKRDTMIHVCIGLRGGGKGLNLQEFINRNKDNFIKRVSLPDGAGRVSLEMTILGCQFLSSWIKCFTKAFIEGKSWNGDFELADFEFEQGHVKNIKIPRKAQFGSVYADITKFVGEVKRILKFSGTARLVSEHPPYLLACTRILVGLVGTPGITASVTIGDAPMQRKHKVLLDTLVCCMTSQARQRLIVELFRKYEGADQEESSIWENAINGATCPDDGPKNKKLLKSKIIGDFIKKRNSEGKPYPSTKIGAFILLRDVVMHATDHDGSCNAPKLGDAIELMIPANLEDFLPDIIKNLINMDVDLSTELLAAIRCACNICDSSLPKKDDIGESSN